MARNSTNNSSYAERDAENARQALVVQPPRIPMPAEAAPAGVDEGQWKALVNAVYPAARTVDGVLLALEYCRHRNLDPFKKPVHIVPMWSTALNREVETVWPGINEYRTTAARTGVWAGNDECRFGPDLRRDFKDSQQRGRGNNKYVERAECPAFEFPEWAQVTVYKIVGGQRVPFVGPKVHFIETFSGEKGLQVPNARWRKAPRQMLEKCAEAAALRRAFPEELGNEYTAEEMEGKTWHGTAGAAIESTATDITPQQDDRPTRDTVQTAWEKLGIEEFHWEEIQSIQKSIDLTTGPKTLRTAKDQFLDRFVADGWPEAALDELELRFDTAIGRLEGEDPRQGASADATAGNDDQSAEEDGNEQAD